MTKAEREDLAAAGIEAPEYTRGVVSVSSQCDCGANQWEKLGTYGMDDVEMDEDGRWLIRLSHKRRRCRGSLAVMGDGMMAFTERKVVEIEWNNDNKGIEFMGRLVAVEEVRYKDGPGLSFYDQRREDARVKSFRFRGATRLNAKLHKSDVGKLVSVRYNGEDKSKEVSPGMNYPKDFTVSVDEDSANPATITDLDVPF